MLPYTWLLKLRNARVPPRGLEAASDTLVIVDLSLVHPAKVRFLDALSVMPSTRTLVFAGEFVSSCAVSLSNASIARRTVAFTSRDDDGEALKHIAVDFKPSRRRTSFLYLASQTCTLPLALSSSLPLYASFGVQSREINVWSTVTAG